MSKLTLAHRLQVWNTSVREESDLSRHFVDESKRLFLLLVEVKLVNHAS